MFNLDQYLERIKLKCLSKDKETALFELQKAQFFTIPFENLDIHLGKKILVDEASIFEKLVNKKRGGYCFELNGLMLTALKYLDYNARPLLARVHLDREPGGRTHQLNLVELNEKQWIVDVGFGGSGLRTPILLEENTFEQPNGLDVKLSEHPDWGWMLETKDKGVWKPTYSFDLGIVIHSDILLGNHFTSTSELTHFTHSRTVSMPTKNGRISIKDNIFTRVENGISTSEDLNKNDTYITFLKTMFNIDLGYGYTDFKSLY